MRISRRLLLTVTLTFGATLAAQQSAPIAHIEAPPPTGQAAIPPVPVSGGVMMGLLTKRVLPSSLPCGVGGAVVMRAIIGTDGKIDRLALLSGPPGAYSNAIMDAVRQWEYKPYLLNGNPVRVSTTITIDVQRNANGCPPPSSVDAVRVSGGVMAGLLTKQVSPFISECGHGGLVVLHAIIAKDGRIQQLSAMSGPEQLYMQVIDAVRQWEYKPYLLNGNPVDVDTTITLHVDVNGCPSGDH